MDPPRIFAGGPYSGRHGGLDGFSHFLPLTRVEELRWRTYLEGSHGLPEREWNGPVKGLLDVYIEGLEGLDRAANRSGARFTLRPADERLTLVAAAEPAFRELLYAHAVEGTYGDPVYGGNFEGRGWTAIAYEGDRHPIGYSQAEMLFPERG